MTVAFQECKTEKLRHIKTSDTNQWCKPYDGQNRWCCSFVKEQSPDLVGGRGYCVAYRSASATSLVRNESVSYNNE